MQPFSRAIMTDSGSRLFMKAQAGEAKIKFTKIAVGDGDYSEEERKISSQQIKTELKSLKNSYQISKIEVVSDHSVKVTALITNYDPISEEAVVDTGYYINEMGLFAKESEDEEGETEVLYSIAIVEDETGDFMPPFDGNNPAQIIQEYYATVNNAEEVTIEMGKGAVALAEDLEKIKILDFDDSGEIEGIESFADFMSSFVKNTSIYQFFSNMKAGLKYVLHTGQLVNSGMCETPGEFALDAAYGKVLTDQITGLYSDIYNLEQITLNVEVICNIAVGSAFGGWVGYANYIEKWDDFIKTKGAKKEIARWTEGAFFHNYHYSGALAYIYGNEVIVNSFVENGRYFVKVTGIIIK